MNVSTPKDQLDQLGTLFETLYSGGGVVCDSAWLLGKVLYDLRGKEPAKRVAHRAEITGPSLDRIESGYGNILFAEQLAAAHGYDLQFVLVKKSGGENGQVRS